MDGFRVMNAADSARVGDVFISGTGNLNVWGRDHFPLMPDGAILANAGHFNDEFELPALEEQSVSSREVRPFTREYLMADGRRIYVLADGRLVNLGAAEGHPAMVMDMSFANQALGLEWLRAHLDELEPAVYGIPEDIDREVARIKLASMGIRIDPMTAEQKAVQRVLRLRHVTRGAASSSSGAHLARKLKVLQMRAHSFICTVPLMGMARGETRGHRGAHGARGEPGSAVAIPTSLPASSPR